MVATQAALDDEPSFLLVPRGEAMGAGLRARGVPLDIGRGRILREGGGVALLSLGARLAGCIEAAGELAAHGVHATVADVRFAWPLDEDLLRRLARGHELLVTVEEGSNGGFASQVLRFLAREDLLHGRRGKFRAMVLPARSAGAGSQARPDAARLDGHAIAATAMGAMGRDLRATGAG
jgi:1-deoxy-D-xylulose-5-phosphate synthase